MKLSETYKNIFFILINKAYLTSLEEKRFKLDWDENDFSELLNHYISQNPISIKHKIFCKTENKNFNPNEELIKGYADKLSRIDFVFCVFSKAERHEYFMEAKNLQESSYQLKRRYIDTGIGNFVSKKYQNGNLIGYLLEGETHKAVGGINSLLNLYNRKNESLNHIQHKFIENYYESKHTEIGKLKHLIFDFTTT